MWTLHSILDDKPVLSCSILAARVDGHKVTTLEGLKEEAEEFGAFIADREQSSVVSVIRGMIMNALALFRENEFRMRRDKRVSGRESVPLFRV